MEEPTYNLIIWVPGYEAITSVASTVRTLISKIGFQVTESIEVVSTRHIGAARVRMHIAGGISGKTPELMSISL